MINQDKALNCYTKLFPKWTAIVVFVVGIIGMYFLPATSVVFYLWLGLCSLFIVKTLTQKQEKEPVLVVGENGIQLQNDQFYPFSEIEKVMAFSSKKLKFRSISFKLYFKKGAPVEFCVDDLNVKPQYLLDVINEKIK